MRMTLRHSVAPILGVASIILGSSVAANAQTSFTALYDFTGTAGTQTSQAVVAASVPTGLAFSDIVRGSAITGNAGANSINSKGFNTTALNTSAFYGFTVTPSSSTYSLTTLAFTDQRSGTGPLNFSVRSSVDGFTTDLFTYSYVAATTASSQSFALSTIPALQNLKSSVTIEIFGWNASSAAGTYRLTSPSAGTGFTVAGVLAGGGAAATPEPGAVALLLSGMGTFGIAVVRRRKG